MRPTLWVRSSRRKANTEASSPGHMATVFVALAIIGSRRAPSSAGKERKEPPPAIAFTAPATNAAIAGTMKRCQVSMLTIRNTHALFFDHCCGSRAGGGRRTSARARTPQVCVAFTSGDEEHDLAIRSAALSQSRRFLDRSQRERLRNWDHKRAVRYILGQLREAPCVRLSHHGLMLVVRIRTSTSPASICGWSVSPYCIWFTSP